MKTFINRLTFGVGVAFIASGLLIGMSEFAPKQVEVVRQAVVQIETTVADATNPLPTPTPVPSPIPTPIPTPVDIPSPIPTPIGPQPFPPAAQIPQTPVPAPAPALGVPTPPVVIPETMVTISVAPCSGPNFDVTTGGCKGTAPFVVTYTSNFQGGFPGLMPIFTWSDGTVGQTDQVTYSTPGNYKLSVKVDEVYNGVTYEAGSANSVPIAVS
jgi:hypothetical protein